MSDDDNYSVVNFKVYETWNEAYDLAHKSYLGLISLQNAGEMKKLNLQSIN